MFAERVLREWLSHAQTAKIWGMRGSFPYSTPQYLLISAEISCSCHSSHGLYVASVAHGGRQFRRTTRTMRDEGEGAVVTVLSIGLASRTGQPDAGAMGCGQEWSQMCCQRCAFWRAAVLPKARHQNGRSPPAYRLTPAAGVVQRGATAHRHSVARVAACASPVS